LELDEHAFKERKRGTGVNILAQFHFFFLVFLFVVFFFVVFFVVFFAVFFLLLQGTICTSNNQILSYYD